MSGEEKNHDLTLFEQKQLRRIWYKKEEVEGETDGHSTYFILNFCHNHHL